MSTLDLLINEVSEKFGIGGKAAPLLSGLLSLMTSQQSGGIPGFIDQFRRAGLGDLVSSWISGGANSRISPHQLESALGNDTIDRLANRLGLSNSIISSALAYLTPRIIDYITPNGVVPTSLPASLNSYLTGVSSAVSTAAESGGATLLKVLPIVALALLGFMGYRYCSSAPLEAQSTAMLTSATPVMPTINSTLSLNNIDGKIRFSGVVPDEKTRQAILDQLKANFGEGNFTGNITVDANAKPITWLGNLGAALRDFKVPGAELSFDGDAIRVGGSILAAAKTGLVDRLKSAFGATANIQAVNLNVDEAVQSAVQKTKAALAGLVAGFTAPELVKALNLDIVNFASGSAVIPDQNLDLLKQSAAAIKNAPKGTVIEVGGHTDNTGNAAANQRLSQQRAEAVRAFLIKQGVNPASVTARGYGDSNAVASNDTEEGRFKNRRIEYAVVK